MKKTSLLTGVLFLLFTIFSASLHAQTDTTVKPTITEPAKTMTEPAKPVTTDQWNNYSPEKYKMLPMPPALTQEKIFPVIGKYTMTAANATTPAESTVTITIDESNKGIAWVDGLPQGRIKTFLRKSPGTYIIPAQKLADEKDLAAGVMIFNKESNTLDICIGCAYNNDDPASAFVVAEPVAEEPVAKTKKGTAKTKTKEKPVKTWKYSGTKIAETTASVTPMQ